MGYDGHSAHVLQEHGLEAALQFHMTTRLFPRVDHMTDVCREAIWLAAGGEWDEMLLLPEGTTWRGETEAPVAAIVEGHNLWSLVDGVRAALDNLDEQEDEE